MRNSGALRRAGISIERSNLTSKGVTFIETSEKEDFLSYNELYFVSMKVFSFFQNQGLKPNNEWVF